MDENEKTEEREEKTPADIMREMREEFDERIKKKDEELEALKTQHAKELRDLLTGRDTRAEKAKEGRDVVKTLAKQIKKNLGYKEE